MYLFLPGVGVPEKMHSNFIVSASVVLISVISFTNVGGVCAAKIIIMKNNNSFYYENEFKLYMRDMRN